MGLEQVITMLNDMLNFVLSIINGAVGVLLGINFLGFPLLGWVALSGIIIDVVNEVSPNTGEDNE